MGTARACNMAKSLPVISLLFVAALALAAPTPTKNIVPTNEAFTSNSSNQDFPPCHFVAVSPCPAREPSVCYLGYMTAEGATLHLAASQETACPPGSVFVANTRKRVPTGYKFGFRRIPSIHVKVQENGLVPTTT